MMTQDMADEINRLKNIEIMEGMKVPVPHFFYIQRYGREIGEQMEDILSCINKKSWFLFRTDAVFRQEGLFRSFLLELEKHAKLGREYQECVVLELDEDICHQEEFPKLLEYLKSKEEQFFFLFTMKKSRNTVSIQRSMEQYFFVRTIYAGQFRVEEQLDIIRNTCEEYHCRLSEKAVQILWDGLENKKWEENEFVACRLKNSVCKLLYEEVLKGEFKEQQITTEMAFKLLEHMDNEMVKKVAIGFCKGGYSYE